jgi:thiol-disulfide isomerase/thioredoxin
MPEKKRFPCPGQGYPLRNIFPFLLALALFLAPVRAEAGRAAHVPWAEDITWHEVTDQAGEGDAPRPILIDFYAQWCGPCKLLDAFVYNEPEVISELSDVVTFKVDIDKPEYLELKEQFNITLLPTLIWCDEKGREIDRFTGSVSAREFLKIIRAFRVGGNTFNSIIDLVAAKPEDPGLLFDLARRHAERGNQEQARVLYRRLMNLRYKADRRVVVDGMLGLAAMELAEGNRDRALDIARRSALVYGPEDLGATEGLMAIAAYQGALRDTTSMLGTYKVLIGHDDTNAVALDAYARVATEAGLDLEQASRYALRAVVMSDDNPRMMETLARSYFRRDLYRKAIRWMEKAAQADPANPRFSSQLILYQETLKSKAFLYRGRRR